MLDPTTGTRNRQRRSRLRRKQGWVLLRIEADEFALVEALQRAGRLTGEDGLARARIEWEAELVDTVERMRTGEPFIATHRAQSDGDPAPRLGPRDRLDENRPQE